MVIIFKEGSRRVNYLILVGSCFRRCYFEEIRVFKVSLCFGYISMG